jgi:exonuclease III
VLGVWLVLAVMRPVSGGAATNDIGDLLGALNTNPSYDFNHILNSFYNDDNNDINTIDLFDSKYYDCNSLINTFQNTSGSLFLSINICSLMSKFNSLSEFFLNLTNKNLNVELLALQETWAVPYPELLTIPGYKLITKTRANNRGGGVGFYVKNNTSFKVLSNLSPFHEKTFETLTIEITIDKKKSIISNIYRPPNNATPNSDQINNFNSLLDSHLNNLALLNLETYIFTDSNINLLKINNYDFIENYFTTIQSNGFSQLTRKATRIINDSFSLIDHVIVRSNSLRLLSGTVIVDLSDHFMNFLFIPQTKSARVNNDKTSRQFSYRKMILFRDEIRKLRWNNVLSIDNTNESFEAFWNDFNTLFELHFPLTKTRLNRNIHKVNEFMTAGLLVSRKNKNTLHKKPYSTLLFIWKLTEPSVIYSIPRLD